MSLTLHVPESRDLKPRLTVFGVGGAGGNAVNNMIARALEGVDFVVANTDAQSLDVSTAKGKIQLGEELTEGLGAGAKPEVGARAAEESLDKITDHLMGSHMCFITAGMGGGTGTGAAPVIAQAARQMGILTVGVVTKPFQFEGRRRMQQAESGIEELQQYVDTLIVIPNQNLFRIANENTTFTEAFGMADDVLYQGVKGVTDLMVRPGLVNLDFADIRSVMDEMGKAMMGTGEAEGDERAILAAERAIANPLLDEISLQGAKGVLINITGGDDLTLHEVDEASNKISNEVDPNANIIFGSTYDPEMTGRIRVSVVATGIDADANMAPRPRETTRMQPRTVEQAPKADLFGESEAVEVETVTREASESVEADYAATAHEDETRYAVDVNADAGDMPETAEDVAMREAQSEAGQVAMNSPQFEDEARYVEPELPIVEPEVTTSVRTGEEEEAANRANFRQRVQAAAQQEPISAPPAPKPQEKTSRLGMPSLIRKISRGDDVREDPPMAHHAEDRSDVRHIEPMAERRAHNETQTSTSQLTADEAQRVEIPAFLRRKAN